MSEAGLDVKAAEDSVRIFLERNRGFAGSPQLSLMLERLRRNLALQQQVYTGLAPFFTGIAVSSMRLFEQPNRNALLLPGGGARAADQVGVLEALAHLIKEPRYNPFPILCGTSAGALNAVALATQAGNFCTAVDWLARKRMSFTGDQLAARRYWSVPWMVE